MKVIGFLAGCLTLIALWAGIGLLVAGVIEWAWNILIPAIFHGPSIDFSEAFVIYVLLSLISALFKSSTKGAS